MMHLGNLDFTALLPTWMQDDETDVALAAVIDEFARQADEAARKLSVWDRIDDLDEETLDMLAVALDISWWDSEATITAKRELVKCSDYVHSRMGTVAALEAVAAAYLGDGHILEWFEYDGHPHRFKITTHSLAALIGTQARIVQRVMETKRLSAKLESILVYLTANTSLRAGAALVSHDTVRIIARENVITAHAGAAIHSYDAVRMSAAE